MQVLGLKEENQSVLNEDSVSKEKSAVPVEAEEPPVVEEVPDESVPQEKELLNGRAAVQVEKTEFDDNAVDYEGDDLALEVNKEEFLDLMDDEEDEEEAPKPPSGCFYCDDVTVDVSDSHTYAVHLREQHGVRKNVHFLTEVTVARQRQGNICCLLVLFRNIPEH